jgi:hypothetical protein
LSRRSEHGSFGHLMTVDTLEDSLKIFISWSGSPSSELAEATRAWLQDVLQSVKPFVSCADIEKGRRWTSEIAAELEDSNYGIICVAENNVDKPWLNFEAGALSRSIAQARVSPILFNVEPSSVTGPLTQFQFTQYERSDMRRLIGGINELTEIPLESPRLESAFNRCWQELDNRVQRYLASFESNGGTSGLVRRPEEMIAEILTIVRQQQLDAVWPPTAASDSPYLGEIITLLRTQEKFLSRIEVARSEARPIQLERSAEELKTTQMSVTVGRLIAAVEHAASLTNVSTAKFVQIRGLVEMLYSELRPALDLRAVDYERREWEP